jgi:hypothetical protein
MRPIDEDLIKAGEIADADGAADETEAGPRRRAICKPGSSLRNPQRGKTSFRRFS